MQKRKSLSVSLLLTLILFLLTSATVRASLIKDFVEDIKNNIISPGANGELTIESDITFAKDGDVNKNGAFDGGDLVTFSFQIKNFSGKDYPLSTIKTILPSDSINYIHKVKGVTGIEQKDEFVELTNIYIKNNKLMNISFDARLTYFNQTTKSLTISTVLLDMEDKKLKETSNKSLDIEASSNKLFSITSNVVEESDEGKPDLSNSNRAKSSSDSAIMPESTSSATLPPENNE